MYSRYIPRPGGGYDRRLVQDPPRPAPSPPTGAGVPDSPRFPAGPGAPGPPRPAPPPRPPARPPGPYQGPPPGGPGGLFGPNSLLGSLLPHPLDPEELLVLAILLLAMKQDGAAPMELLIAAAIYLMF